MPSCGMLRRVALVRSDISGDLVMEAVISSEISVLTRATRRNIPEDCNIHYSSRDFVPTYVFMIWCLDIEIHNLFISAVRRLICFNVTDSPRTSVAQSV
jgi:hypothetical protein